MKRQSKRRTAYFPLLLALLAAPLWGQPANAPTLAAISGLEPGQWQLRSSEGGASRSVCVSDTRTLLQTEHAGVACNRFVIANDPRQATVHYTCPGAGHGRTTIRVETPRLIQIDTQGVSRNEPFAVRLEGRRTGACSTRVGLR